MEPTVASPRASWRARARDWMAECAGLLDYWRRPDWRAPWGGPFNGQELRRLLFDELVDKVAFVGIVETGTYRGTTTRYFRRVTGAPIHSFEISPRHFGFARAQVRSLRDVWLHRCDSRAGIAALAHSQALARGPVFFYLDAHWRGDLPLLGEMELAFAHWPEAVVMIDDFAVPDDAGYRFDSYAGEALSLGYLLGREILPGDVWFPRGDSARETGARRGCVVLTRDAILAQRLDSMTTLRRWPVP